MAQRGLSFGRVAWICVFSLICLTQAALAEERLALIVANQSYAEKVGPLANPHKDAALMKAALEAAGFVVTVRKDLGRGALLAAVEAYAQELGRAGPDAVGFFYYTGHGAARSGGRNYIIPVNVADAASSALWHDSAPMSEVRALLRENAPRAAHIVVFDACRSELRLPVKGAEGGKGFSPVTDWGGMLVAYSTDPDATASDGAPSDPAGPYAQALAAELRAAEGSSVGVEAATLFSRVRFAVRKRAPGQSPWFLHGLDRQVMFGATAAPPAAPAGPSDLQSAPPAAAGALKFSFEYKDHIFLDDVLLKNENAFDWRDVKIDMHLVSGVSRSSWVAEPKKDRFDLVRAGEEARLRSAFISSESTRDHLLSIRIRANGTCVAKAFLNKIESYYGKGYNWVEVANRHFECEP